MAKTKKTLEQISNEEAKLQKQYDSHKITKEEFVKALERLEDEKKMLDLDAKRAALWSRYDNREIAQEELEVELAKLDAEKKRLNSKEIERIMVDLFVDRSSKTPTKVVGYSEIG